MRHTFLINRKKRITKEVRRMMQKGYRTSQVKFLLMDCLAEAEIQEQLPKCSCKDVNQCSTWCQAKARFTLNPPD